MNMTKHQHLKLDQSKIDRAKKLLGAKTEQEDVSPARHAAPHPRAFQGGLGADSGSVRLSAGEGATAESCDRSRVF